MKMPRMKFAGWDRLNTRWVKMLNGKRYRITCEELGLPKSDWTKEGSIDLAKKWWIQKLGELNSQEPQLQSLPDELRDYIQKLKNRSRILEMEGRNPILYQERLKEVRKQIKDGEYDICEIDPYVSMIAKGLDVVSGGEMLSGLGVPSLNLLLGESFYWAELEKKYEKIDQIQTIGHWLNEFKNGKFEKNNESTIIREKCFYEEIFNLKLNGQNLLRKEMQIDCINEQKISDVYQAYKLMKLDPETKKKRWVWFKKFVRYILEHAGKPPNRPRNLDSKDFVFSKENLIDKPEVDLNEIRSFLKNLPDRLRLYALLALNCAMNNVDIALLEHSQIDLDKKTLKRKRIKTKGWAKVPTVTYYLWAETVRLLKRFANEKSQFVLTDDAGKGLYLTNKEIENVRLYDKVGVQWRDHFKGTEDKKFTLKDFRFFGADLLGNHQKHMLYKDIFLGHSPKSVADRNYSSINFNVINQCKYLESIFYSTKGKRKKNLNESGC